MPYTGNHRRIVVYGAIAKDGRQLFRTREMFDAPTFVWYMKELQRHFGKVVVMDKASPPGVRFQSTYTAYFEACRMVPSWADTECGMTSR